MAVYSRAGRPLRRVSNDQVKQARLNGATELMVLGDGLGNVEVLSDDNSDNHGEIWVRRFLGINENRRVLTSPPFKGTYKHPIYPANNSFVNCSLNPVNLKWQVERNDAILSAAQGLDISGLNPMRPQNHNKAFRRLRNGRIYFTGTNTKFSIEDLLYIFNGTIKNAQSGQSDNNDLSSHIPLIGFERLVGVGLDASTNTPVVVQGTQRTITKKGWGVADLQELVDLFDLDVVLPIAAVELADGQTVIRQRSVIDLRQFINVAGSGGNSATNSGNDITKSNTIPSGKDAFFAGGLTITGGLTIEGGLTVLV